MKRSLSIVAVLALVATASVAQAADKAWFTLEGQGAGCAGLQVSQGQDQALTITNKPLSCSTLTIGYRVSATFYDAAGTLAGYSINLGTTSSGVTASNVVHLAPGYDTNIPGSLNAGGGNLLTNQGRISSNGSGTTGVGGLLMTFQLNLTGKAPGDVRTITGDFGTSGQAYGAGAGSGFRWLGNVAGGPLSYGSNNYTNGTNDTTPGWGPQAVISIANIPVPEPTTLALLGFGALALLRRKR